MIARRMTALLAAAVVAAPAVAQDQPAGAAWLRAYLHGSAMEGQVSFDYAHEGCEGVVSLSQTYPSGAVRQTRTRLAYAELDLERYQIGEVESGEFAQLILDPREGAAPFPFSGTLDSDDPETLAGWEAQGATCADNRCVLESTLAQAALIVAGPNAGSRAEFVLSDLRSLQSECALTEEGTN